MDCGTRRRSRHGTSRHRLRRHNHELHRHRLHAAVPAACRAHHCAGSGDHAGRLGLRCQCRQDVSPCRGLHAVDHDLCRRRGAGSLCAHRSWQSSRDADAEWGRGCAAEPGEHDLYRPSAQCRPQQSRPSVSRRQRAVYPAAQCRRRHRAVAHEAVRGQGHRGQGA